MNKKKAWIILLVCVSLFLGASRISALTESQKLEKRARSGKEKIAVLPLENLSGQFGADEQVMSGLRKSLQRQFYLVPADQVEEILTSLRVRHTGFLNTEQIRKIGRRLRVKALLLGAVDTYQQKPVPRVSFFCKLISTKGDAPILWSRYFCASGQQRVYLLQRNKPIKWSSLIQSLAEDLVDSLPKDIKR